MAYLMVLPSCGLSTGVAYVLNEYTHFLVGATHNATAVAEFELLFLKSFVNFLTSNIHGSFDFNTVVLICLVFSTNCSHLYTQYTSLPFLRNLSRH